MDAEVAAKDTLKSRARSALFRGVYGGIQKLAGSRRMIVKGQPQHGFALTFDDGPHPEVSPRVSDALLSVGAVGTFFLIGAEARQHPSIVRRLADDGHIIGHHSMTHPRLSALSPRKVIAEWRSGRETVENIVGASCPYFRPPYGSLPLYLLPFVWKAGDTIVMWSCSTRDYTGEPVAALTQRLRSRGIDPGDILLLHDVAAAAPALIKEIVAIGAAAGVAATGVDQMLSR